jgi:diguanylate cyclase (GGDEF)-like protein
MSSFKFKLVAYFLLLALVPLAAAFVGFRAIAARSETRQADARLQAGLRATVALYDAQIAAARARVERVARQPPLVRALARHDRAAVARVLPAGVRVVAPGFRVGAVPTGRVVTQSVTLSSPRGVLGRVVASVVLNDALARTLANGSGLADGDRITFVREPAPLQPETIERGGVRYRAVAAPPLEILTPQARIDAANRRTEMRLLALLLGTLLLVGFVAWLEGRSIVRTIRRLVGAANAIALGDLERRVPVSGRDELAGLARSFNDMAEQLGARLLELEAERGRLHDAITLFGDALVATHDKEQLLRVVLDALLEATGATGGLVIVDGGIAAQAGTIAGDERIEVPLRAGRMSYGRIVLSGTHFSDDDRMTAVSLAAHAVVALDNAQLHRIVEQQALVDGLTGLSNRRAGERALEKELARAQRFGGSLALVLCDLDNFKSVNDRYGHLTGDDVLRELASVFAETVRTVDVAARWGGEEFALVLPGTDAEGGAQLAERAREALEARTLLTPDGEPLRITASFGVAAFPTHGERLVEAADAALYRAKRSGKNRVESAETPPAVRDRS